MKISFLYSRRYLRLDEGAFQDLLQKVDPLIRKMDTTFRKSITSCDRLTITLRYLATGMHIIIFLDNNLANELFNCFSDRQQCDKVRIASNIMLRVLCQLCLSKKCS